MLNIEKIVNGNPVNITKNDWEIEISFQLSYATFSSIKLEITYSGTKAKYNAEISGFTDLFEEYITEKYDNPEWFHDLWEKLHNIAAKFILERRDEKKELPIYF